MASGSLRDVFTVLDEIAASGVVEGWAVVGAMGALFYAEPTRTYDLDVAVLLPGAAGPILSLGPLYSWLSARGFEPRGEHVVLHGVPVQFLSGDRPLWREAILEARRFDYEGVPVRVASPEHLVAMILEAPTARRMERAALLLESGAVDRARLRAIAARFALRIPEGWHD